MTAILSKAEKVLDFYTIDHDGTALYHQPEAEHLTLWPLSKADYEDMGEPAQITVTILPGDFLNTAEGEQ